MFKATQPVSAEAGAGLQSYKPQSGGLCHLTEWVPPPLTEHSHSPVSGRWGLSRGSSGSGESKHPGTWLDSRTHELKGTPHVVVEPQFPHRCLLSARTALLALDATANTRSPQQALETVPQVLLVQQGDALRAAAQGSKSQGHRGSPWGSSKLPLPPSSPQNCPAGRLGGQMTVLGAASWGGEAAGTQGRSLREEGLCWERAQSCGKWSDLATALGQEKEMTSPFTTGICGFLPTVSSGERLMGWHEICPMFEPSRTGSGCSLV